MGELTSVPSLPIHTFTHTHTQTTQLSVALSITGIVLFNSVLSLIGHAAITSTLYSFIFTYLLPNELHQKQRGLKKEILAGRRELSNTSAQDDFAKWAKIRRRVDKQVGELEALSE